MVRDPTGQVSGAVAEAIARQFVTSIESPPGRSDRRRVGVTVDAADLDQVTSSATTAIDEVGRAATPSTPPRSSA
ncbi:MAG: hypothetical protein R2713_02780 [Ilumatobacteraceae bacterium]